MEQLDSFFYKDNFTVSRRDSISSLKRKINSVFRLDVVDIDVENIYDVALANGVNELELVDVIYEYSFIVKKTNYLELLLKGAQHFKKVIQFIENFDKDILVDQQPKQAYHQPVLINFKGYHDLIKHSLSRCFHTYPNNIFPPLSDHTISELISYAQENKVDLRDCIKEVFLHFLENDHLGKKLEVYLIESIGSFYHGYSATTLNSKTKKEYIYPDTSEIKLLLNQEWTVKKYNFEKKYGSISNFSKKFITLLQTSKDLSKKERLKNYLDLKRQSVNN